MTSRMPRPRKPVVLLALALAAMVFDLPVQTQDWSSGRRLGRVNGHAVVEGEVLVKYRDQLSMAAQQHLEAQADAEVLERFDRRGVKRLRSRGKRTTELLDALRADPNVEYAEPNYILYALTVPNDPSFGNLWGLLNTGFNAVGGGGLAGADISAETAWNTTTGSRAAVVGVIDTGIDYNHPDLAANIWSAPASFQVTISGQTITCAAGTHGFNGITRTCNPMDDQYHGTHVAGTIGAVGNNGIGVAGVAWATSMMGLKFLNSSGSGSTADAIATIEFAIQAKAAFASSAGADIRVLSNSWGGGGYSSALVDAINAANAAGMLFVAAAGNANSNNDSAPSYPASYNTPNMVAVAASDSSDQRSSFSNYGASSVHLAAPGTAIYSTMPNNSYSSLNGTSMATPQVSGAAMLALSMCSVNTAQLKSLVLSTVDTMASFTPVTITGGRLNVARMIADCPYPKITALSLSPSVPSPQETGTAVTWTATPTGGQAPYEYQWLVYDGSTWGWPTAWGSANTFAWTPAATANYQIAVRARSAWNSGSRDIAVAQPFSAGPRATSVGLASSLASPQGAGTTVTWTATPVGGQAPYEYQWLTYDGSSWSAPTSWASGNTFAWTPAAGGTHQVAVRVRSAWNTGSRDLAVAETFTVLPKATSLSITPSVASPQGLGTTVTWTATAGGGQAPYEYQWLTFNGSAWSAPTAWSTSQTFAWTPTLSADHQVAVRVRSAWNTGNRDMAVAQAFAIRPKVTNLTLTPSAAAPQGPGTAITWTASPTGGQAPYTYQWLIHDGATWGAPTAWSSANTLSWTPSGAADYHIAVRVRSAWNTDVRDFAVAEPFTVKAFAGSVSITPSLSSPRAPGTSITWTATPTGGDAPYTYQWLTFNGSTWSAPTAWSSSNTFVWTPGSAATHQVAVRVRSVWNTGNRDVAVGQTFVIQ